MSRSRVYTVSMDAVSLSATQDLFTIQAASGIPIEIHSIQLSQATLTAWEAEQIALKYVPATVTITGGTSATARPVLPGDVAASATCKINNTTIATSTGTIYDLFADDFMVINGFYWSPAGDEDRFVIKGGDAVVLRLLSAPSAAMTVSGTITFAEMV